MVKEIVHIPRDRMLAFCFGVVCLTLSIVLVFIHPALNQSQWVVVVVLLGLSAGGVGAILPGLISADAPGFAKATGGAAFFVCVILIAFRFPPNFVDPGSGSSKRDGDVPISKPIDAQPDAPKPINAPQSKPQISPSKEESLQAASTNDGKHDLHSEIASDVSTDEDDWAGTWTYSYERDWDRTTLKFAELSIPKTDRAPHYAGSLETELKVLTSDASGSLVVSLDCILDYRLEIEVKPLTNTANLRGEVVSNHSCGSNVDKYISGTLKRTKVMNHKYIIDPSFDSSNIDIGTLK
jgi:hypothetical protein